MKLCCFCKEFKNLSEFRKRTERKGNQYSSRCKKCLNLWASEWRKKNPGSYLNSQIKYRLKETEPKRRSLLKSRYNLSVENYYLMSKSQNNSCAICGTHKSKLTKGLFVDHCHKTKKVRGLLCTKCNTGIGQFSESQTKLLYAIRYLKGIRMHKDMKEKKND